MAAFPLALLRCCFVRPSSKSEANCRKAERARFMVRRGRSLCFGVSSLYSSSNLNGSHSAGRSCGLPLSGMCLPLIRPPFTDKQERLNVSPVGSRADRERCCASSAFRFRTFSLVSLLAHDAICVIICVSSLRTISRRAKNKAVGHCSA